MKAKLAIAFLAGGAAIALMFVGATAGIYYFVTHAGQTPGPDGEPQQISATAETPVETEDGEAAGAGGLVLPLEQVTPDAPTRVAPRPRPRPVQRPRVFSPPVPVETPPVRTEPVVLPQSPAPPPPGAGLDAAEDTPVINAVLESGTSLLPSPPRVLTIPAGTLLSVRLAERLSSDRNLRGDVFQATFEEPLVIDGWVIAERGARAYGRVIDVEPAGRIRGTADLRIELTGFNSSDGQRVEVQTASFLREGVQSKRDDAVKVGIGAAIGAALGAAIGGGKGAAIGAASGGAAGGGAVIATRGKAAVLEPETRIRFRVDRDVTITERK